MLLGSPFVATLAVAATPPEPSLRKFPSAAWGFGLMFLFFAVVVLISLMSSKRGHQD
ncbi:MAG: hypothetical protein ACKVIO_07095 [Phycisphaerales bacterium]